MAKFAAVTPSDSQNLPAACPSFWIGTGGTLKVTAQGDTDAAAVTLTGVPAGLLNLPWPVQKIWAGGTSASGIIALGLV